MTKPLLEVWLGGYDEKTKTYLGFVDPIESLKPKLIHVREVDPIKVVEEKSARYRRCKHCTRTAILSLDVCTIHYKKG